MTVYDHSTRSSGEPSTWPPAGGYHSDPDDYYTDPPPTTQFLAAAPIPAGHRDEVTMNGRYRVEAPLRERYREDVPADLPSRPPAEWTPAHADGPPPAWTPPEKGAAGPAAAPKNKRLALVGGIVAVAVAGSGVTAGIMAAVGGGSSAASGPGGGQGIGQGGPGGTQNAATALHGTYVVSDGNGGYTTQLTQTGTVSTISGTSITVKSDDGYSKTYVISTSTTVGTGRIADVLKGHTVRIVATSVKQKITASSITDTSLAGAAPAGN
ncbi:hypothetical protein [Paractinoplanes toevensis]|uniref:DUF5666 domain-containing protein n=1 Tax=Paractinoplanes toevensis TaxID=571911 RepID=A0A919TEC3_9ACTN|nr:hypothetical protein [Actinoplanes toevensis]GIM93883.1 hypothetical protein Ato02nite_056760 [Actinoplanes toevensis]